MDVNVNQALSNSYMICDSKSTTQKISAGYNYYNNNMGWYHF